MSRDALLDAMAMLREENKDLRDRLANLVDLPANWALPGVEVKLQASEARLLRVLYLNLGKVVRTANLHQVFYGDRAIEMQPHIKLLHVLVCNIRKKLKATAYEIVTVDTVGYFLRERARAKETP